MICLFNKFTISGYLFSNIFKPAMFSIIYRATYFFLVTLKDYHWGQVRMEPTILKVQIFLFPFGYQTDNFFAKF